MLFFYVNGTWGNDGAGERDWKDSRACADLGQDIWRGCGCGGGGGKDHEAKVTTPSTELWGHAPRKIFEFWVSETPFPSEIPTYTTHWSSQLKFYSWCTFLVLEFKSIWGGGGQSPPCPPQVRLWKRGKDGVRKRGRKGGGEMEERSGGGEGGRNL